MRICNGAWLPPIGVTRLAKRLAMPSPVAVIAIAVVVGAIVGAQVPIPFAGRWLLVALLPASAWCWYTGRPYRFIVLIAAGFALSAAIAARTAVDEAIQSPLRAHLEARYGRFAIDTTPGDPAPEPLLTRFEILEDAAPLGDIVLLRVAVIGIRSEDHWDAIPREGVRLTVGGAIVPATVDHWRAGRTAVAPVAYRRPASYFDQGVDDAERELLLDGTTLFGSVKSGLLVDVVSAGSRRDEWAAAVRVHVRRSIARFVGNRDPIAAAIVTAVLIGDRTGLPDEVRTRLQGAGTYHVIAISGGNIALVAGLALACLFVLVVPGRAAAAATIVLLAFHAEVVTAGPSVWRATVMAMIYLAARALDHRTSPSQSIAVATILLVLAGPLDVSDPGFILTFGATVALVEGGRRSRALLPWLAGTRRGDRWRFAWRIVEWAGLSIAASLAVEIALLPVSAQLFSRVSLAGVVLNLVAVPLMAVVQVAGTIICAAAAVPSVAQVAGAIAMAASDGIVNSARLVDVAPSLAPRVPPPGILVLAAYYSGIAWFLWSRRRRAGGLVIAALAAVAIIAGWPMRSGGVASRRPDDLRLTMIDVGQGESMLLEVPGAAPLLIDAGGAPFGSSGDEIGTRVVVPALWARGVRSLGALVVTHGDPDHIGGGAAVVRDFSPPRLWLGVPVPTHLPTRDLMRRERESHGATEWMRQGREHIWGRARIRVLNPPSPDWERPRVRNDDSIVLDVRFGDVSLLLTGDISEEVERDLVPRLSPARLRILKVAHHGSRTSSSRVLLDAWQPQIALISCGRGNRFGHPTAEVLARLASVGARVYRTDLDGEVTVESDGRDVRVRTFITTRRQPAG